MLKRLELIGFKSFADRTWFTFAPGLTAVVGPNGSGKSNVVDAVKWILGEQSAKSLRGGEMADVIFNGSSSRRALAIAEVTLTLDNSGRELNTDAAEVAVTRRVHRDGTGEYLINGQPSRLKDIREMFLGSGAGSTAYCIIEQGRVDALLQASARDRRAIFEEAAGISRFKAKKQEALRKLEHTAENLTRLRDIFGEVEGRLRRVRLDAEKARKFQEYSTRLRDLRLGLGLREYHTFTQQLVAEEARGSDLRGEVSAAHVQVAVWEAEASQIDAALSAAEAEAAQSNNDLTDVGRQIATLQERFYHELAKFDEAAVELAVTRRRTTELSELIAELDRSAEVARNELAAADGEAEARRAKVAELETAATAIESELAALRQKVHDGRDRQFHLVGRAAALASEAASTRTQVNKFQKDRDRKRREGEGKAAELAAVGRVMDTLGRKDSDLQSRLALARQALADRRTEQEEYRFRANRLAEVLEDLRVRRSGLTGRIEILENLERTQEGLGTGVREILGALTGEASPLSRAVIGLVADSLRVPRELAPLIDVALGETASHFVVRDPSALDVALAARGEPLAGRVSFVPLSETEPLAHGADTVTADRWVTCDNPDLAGLPRQLLGRTLIVDNVAAARQAHADPELAGYRFVTRAGELLAADGTLTVGPHHAGTGIVSRKSELRELRALAAAMDDETAEVERGLAGLRDRADSLAGPIVGLEEEIRALTSSAADVQTEILKQTQQRERLTDEIALIRHEREMLEEEIGRLDAAWQQAQVDADATQREADELKANVEAADRAIRAQEQARALRQQEQTAAQVALAETVQRAASRRDVFQQLEQDLARARAEADRVRRHEGVLHSRLIECGLGALRASAGLADAYAVKETHERQVARLAGRRDADRARRVELANALTALRAETQVLVEQLHAHELTARDLTAARDRIADRLREDYQLDLAAEYGASPLAAGGTLPGEWDASAAAADVETLRKRVRHLGNVSLEALAELTEVEARATELQKQIDDLTQAEQSLRAVIGKINEDSRKLFAETYDAVRAHFQELFRKLFGGGMADVVLDTPDDVLESGVDIVARPPGKELRGISLMSGGEKTLTAVALLLAIFRSKPSPFCLLDEVDAALDEANTERLAQTIRDFTDRSQFIVITHKKRTMAYADVLYGVTMQESGVSKQIAVRFDDYEEPGERLRAA
jgi:chromosome segregation protein